MHGGLGIVVFIIRTRPYLHGVRPAIQRVFGAISRCVPPMEVNLLGLVHPIQPQACHCGVSVEVCLHWREQVHTD